ncbi:MAG: hypothetical protein AAF799_19230 [Myxococcota bacterium]
MSKKIVEIEVDIDVDGVTMTSVAGATADPRGHHVKVKASEGQTAVFKIKGQTTAVHATITEVHAVDECGESFDQWSDIGGAHQESTPYTHGTEFVVEVHNTNNSGPTPRGGGYFRVLDEGAGGPP